MRDVSIIIVNYNTKVLTKDCINSVVLWTKDINYELIVVDNDSSDGSIDYLKESQKDIKIIESKTNLGFGKANNLGVSDANGKYIFLLNSDTVLLNNAVKLFFDYIEIADKNTGAIGSLLLDKNLNQIHSSGFFPNKWNFFRKLFINDDKFKERIIFGEENYFDVDYLTGANIFMLKSTFEKLNGFDEDFFMYYEDTDLQRRMGAKGLKRQIIKGPKIIHLEGASSKKLSNKKRAMLLKSMLLYFKKHSTRYSFRLYKILFFLLSFLREIFNNYTFKESRKFLKIIIDIK